MTTHFPAHAGLAVLDGDRAQFTVAQANRMLPLVQRIVADLVADHRAWQAGVRELDARVANAGGVPDAGVGRMRRATRRIAADIQHYHEELASLGLECQSIEDGLVDFPSEIDGERVMLCWQLGEPQVAWWHSEEAGFAGRQPIVAAAEDAR